jgi:uncharacterized protein YndB with AHSA1/START domain
MAHDNWQRGKTKYERKLKSKLSDAWNLWTTKQGLESWWGPEGFDSKVRKLEVRPGGEFEIAMTATGEDQIQGLKQIGMPLTSIAHGTFAKVEPERRLAFKTVADFIPGIKPYEVETVVELFEEPGGVKMVVTEDEMHDKRWTEMSTMGMNSQLDKLEKISENAI